MNDTELLRKAYYIKSEKEFKKSNIYSYINLLIAFLILLPGPHYIVYVYFGIFVICSLLAFYHITKGKFYYKEAEDFVLNRGKYKNEEKDWL